jgi:hypothetical protein
MNCAQAHHERRTPEKSQEPVLLGLRFPGRGSLGDGLFSWHSARDCVCTVMYWHANHLEWRRSHVEDAAEAIVRIIKFEAYFR